MRILGDHLDHKWPLTSHSLTFASLVEKDQMEGSKSWLPGHGAFGESESTGPYRRPGRPLGVPTSVSFRSLSSSIRADDGRTRTPVSHVPDGTDVLRWAHRNLCDREERVWEKGALFYYLWWYVPVDSHFTLPDIVPDCSVDSTVWVGFRDLPLEYGRTVSV